MSLSAIYRPIFLPHPVTSILKPKNTQRNGQQSFIIRFLIFTVLEASFLLLGTWCLIHPIQLPTSFANSDTQIRDAKAITTAISVIWHALAGLAAKDIVMCIFSAEWAVQFYQTGTIQPNKTDAVSVITSGLLDQLKYGISKVSTARFRLSLAIILVLLGLGPFGASTMGINLLWIDTIQEIQIANVTLDFENFGLKSETLDRASRIAKSEMLDHLSVGYHTSSQDTLIPWPQPSFSNYQGVVKYMSDIIMYNYSCQWVNAQFLSIDKIPEIPSIKAFINGSIWLYEGQNSLWPCLFCSLGES